MKTAEITTNDLNRSTGDLVKNYPVLYSLFEQNGIEFCCDGNRPLIDHLTTLKIQPENFIYTINQNLKHTDYDDQLTNKESASAIIEHILRVYHDPLPAMMENLEVKIQKIYDAHLHHMPFLEEVKGVYAMMKDELTHHMAKEENILFPYIIALENSLLENNGKVNYHCGSVQNPIRQMEFEHESAGKCLEIIEADFEKVDPEKACNTLHHTIQLFETLKSELHKHIHIENYILHPLAISIEKRLESCSSHNCN